MSERMPGFGEATEWASCPTRHRNGYLIGYYYVVPRKRDTWLDGSPVEVAYLYFDGKWSVIRTGEQKHEAIEEFLRWFGPLRTPDLPPEIEAMLEDDG